MDLIVVLKTLSYISSASILIPFIIGFKHYRTLKPYLRVLFYYACVAFLIEAFNIYYSIKGQNSLFFSHLCTPIEFSAFLFFYFEVLNVKPKTIIYIPLVLLFSIFVVLDIYYFSGRDKVGVASRNTEALILIVFAIVFFYRIMVKTQYTNILSLPAFWINASVLVYFSGNFFLILFSNYLISISDLSYLVFFTINSIFNFSFNLLLGIGLYKGKTWKLAL